MAVIYSYLRSKLESSLRLEAEFYQPKFLEFKNACCRWQMIGRIISFCQYGSSLPLNEEGVGYAIFRLNEIDDCFVDEPAKWVEMSAKEYESFKLHPDDILFCRTNGNPELVGRTGILKHEINAVFASYLVRIRPNRRYVLPEFLAIYLNTRIGKLQIQRRSMQSNQVNVSAAQLKEIPIPILTHFFQKRIAQYVNSAAKHVALSKKIYTQAEQLLLTELNLQEWKPPHTRTYEYNYSQVIRTRRLDSEHFQPKYTELRERIRNYSNSFCHLSDIAILSNETVDPRKCSAQEIDYIELANINQSIGVIESSNRILGKDAPSRARMRLRKGDIIASSVEGSLNKVALVPSEYDGAIGSTGFFVLRPRTVESGYLLALTKSIIIQEQLRCEASGTILTAVSANSLRNIIVPNVSQKKRNKIAILVEQSHAARREAKEILKKAKHAVEIAIEKSEEEALKFLK